MTTRFQIGLVALAVVACAWFGGPARAQDPRADRPPQKQAQAPADHPNTSRPAHPSPNAGRPANPNRPPGRGQDAGRPPARQMPPERNYRTEGQRPPSAAGPSRSNAFDGRADREPGARMAPRPESRADSSRPFVDRMRDLSPPQRERVLQNSRNFQSFSPEQQNRIRQQFNQWDRMSPQQRMDLREKEDTWRRMTPDQRDHIKSNVLPKWRQMPRDRQQTIQQKLGLLQNMPESARNRRLNDPNFTRGMSEEDKAMLRDLSHLHVGGAPDPPGNE